MIWLLLAFLSAALLGFYDVSKKKALQGRPVIPVLFLNTLFCSLIFLPVALHPSVPFGGWAVQKYIVLKSFIVLSSWICGYYGIKNLPLTLVGPINATRPVMVLLGALLLFGERLNLYQWIGVLLAILSFYMLSRSGKKEGIDFPYRVGRPVGVRQRFVRQIPHGCPRGGWGRTESPDGAELLQLLSVCHHGHFMRTHPQPLSCREGRRQG